MPLALSAADRRRLQTAQHVLLAPLEHDDLADWQRRVNRAVRAVVGCDLAFFALYHDEEAHLCSTNADITDGFRRQIALEDRRRPAHRDRLLRQNWQRFEAMGAAAWHEQDLAPREQIEHSSYYQQVCRPNGVRRTMGIAAPHLGAVIVTGFKEADRAGFGDAGKARLQLLAPAFEAGLRAWHRLHRRRNRLARLLDALQEPLAAFDADGALLYRNAALEQCLQDDPDSETLVDALQQWAAIHARRRRADAPPDAPLHTIETRVARYALHAAALPSADFGSESFLIAIERTQWLPTPAQVCARTELTPRQAEVALLLAEGMTDKAIAERLQISPHTARRHTERTLAKLNLSSRAGVALALLRTCSR